MSTPCDPTSLISGAACLECGIPPGMEKAIIISLLCKIANMNCDATTLIQGAACLECGIPPGMQDAVTNYLLCQIANGAGAGGTTQSKTYPLTDGTPLGVSFAHGLSAVPSFVRAVLLCTTNDVGTGIVAGQEISLHGILNGNNPDLPFGYSADTALIYLVYEGISGPPCRYPNPAGGNSSFTSFTNFSFKVYWHA